MRSLLLAAVAVAVAGCPASSDPATAAPALRFASEAAWPERPAPALPAAGRLLVTNNLSDSLSFFDASKVGQAQFPELARVPVGINPVEVEAPHHAAISATGDFFFVPLGNTAPGVGTGPHASHGTASIDGSVLKLRASDNRVVASVRVDPNPGDIAISPDGKQLAVSHYDLLRIIRFGKGEVPSPDSRVELIDTETMAVTARVTVCPAPHGIAYSADGTRVYFACYSDEVAMVRLDAADLPVTRVKVAANYGDAFRPVHQPFGVAVSPLSGDVFISCLASGEVRVLDAATLTIDESRTRSVGGSPFLSAFSPDGNTLWVPHQGDDRISDLDPATGVQRRLLTPRGSGCSNIHQVLPMQDPRYLVAICEGYRVTPGTVIVLDTGTGATLSVTPVGLYPDYIGFARSP